MSNVFLILYPLAQFIVMAGYIPQITRLVRDPDVAKGISLSTWFIWTVGCLITLGYGVFYINDLIFCLITTINLLAHIVIIGLTLTHRYREHFV